MKKSTQLMFAIALNGIVAFIIGSCFYLDVRADTGVGGATRIERGTSLDARNVSPSSTTGTTLFSASIVRPDGMCFNNTSTIVWIGTVSATIDRQTHTNILQGAPILASSTFKLDGQLTGAVYATCDVGVAACNMRCLDGKVAE